jgi:hypothetical protein
VRNKRRQQLKRSARANETREFFSEKTKIIGSVARSESFPMKNTLKHPQTKRAHQRDLFNIGLFIIIFPTDAHA